MRTTKAEKRTRWLLDYERLMVFRKPELAGKIDWDTAEFLFNQGILPDQACEKTLAALESREAQP